MKTLPLALAVILVSNAPCLSQPRIGEWTRQDVEDKKPATMSITENGVINLEARDAVSFFYRPLRPKESTMGLAWRWRTDVVALAAPLDVKGQDDRPLAVHVIFPAPANGSLFDRLARSIRGTIAGPLFQGRMITYVFGGVHAAGTMLRNPYLPDDAAILVLRDGMTPQGQWFEERVNPAADYVRAFGDSAPAASLLSISSDTDDRGGTARASIEFKN